jgi:transposase-like protein
LVAIVDDLRGFPEAINAVFPEKQIQTCIVHLIRNSLDFSPWKGPNTELRIDLMSRSRPHRRDCLAQS